MTIPVGLALWLVTVFTARKLLGQTYFELVFPEAILLTLIIAGYLKLRLGACVLEWRSIRVGRGQVIVTVFALLAVGYIVFGQYYSGYYGIYVQQQQLGLYGDRNSDFSSHLSTANFLMSHAELDSNPVYFQGAAAGGYLFDLLVASCARLLFIDISSAFYIVTPLLAITFWGGLWMSRARKIPNNITYTLGSLLLFYLAFQNSNTAHYNALAAGYCVSMLFLGLSMAANIRNGQRKSTSEVVLPFLTLALVSYVALQFKFFIWAPAAGGLALLISYELVRSAGRLQMQTLLLFAMGVAVMLPLLVLLSASHTGAVSYYELRPTFELSKEVVSGLGLALVLLFGSLLRGGRADRGLLLMLAVAAAGIVVSVVLHPVVYEGGASKYYPMVIVQIALLFAPLYATFNQYRKIAAVTWTACVALQIDLLNMPFGINKELWNYQGVEQVLTGPTANALDVISFLNKHANFGEGVITNYAGLDRYYAFSGHAHVVPFLSSWQYGNVVKQFDYLNRTRLTSLLFENGKAHAFHEEITRDYPKVRYVLVDSELPFIPNPPAESNLIWTNFVPVELDSDLMKLNLDRIVWRDGRMAITYKNVYFKGEAFDGFKVELADVSAIMEQAQAQGILQQIYRKGNVALYRIL